MIQSMASYYEDNPTNNKAARCLVNSCVDMVSSQDPLKPVLQKGLEVHPLTTEVVSGGFFRWTYLYNQYVHQTFFRTEFLSFAAFQDQYDPRKTNITTWSHPTWKMIHYYATLFTPMDNFVLSYKSFISCLQFLLPCGKCRAHLRANLANHPIEKYLVSREMLFFWGYKLHQYVSFQTKKSGISFEEAKRIYRV